MAQRKRYLLEQERIWGFRELCASSFDQASSPLTDHVHPDAVEICFLCRGQQSYWVGGQYYEMRGLDVFMTYPNEVHGTGRLPEEKSLLYYMIVDTVNSTGRFLGFEGGEAQPLAAQINAIPQRLFRGSERIRLLWDQLFHIYETPDPLRRALLKCCALELLNEIVRCSAQRVTRQTGDIAAAAQYIHTHIEEELPLTGLAQLSGLSLSRFKQKFRVQMGMPPGEYILREKVKRAEELICAGASVTQTAYQLNFSSSQHLSIVFKKYRGISPKQSRIIL